MRRPTLLFVPIALLFLVGSSLALARRAQTPLQVMETNGLHMVTVRRFGLFPVVKAFPRPGLDVTARCRRDLRRIGFALPQREESLLSGVERTIEPASDRYALMGGVAGSPAEVVQEFAPLCKGTHLRQSGLEQLTGTCADGRTSLIVQSFRDHGVTYADVYLDIPK